MLPDGSQNQIISKDPVVQYAAQYSDEIYTDIHFAGDWLRLYNGVAGFGHWFEGYSQMIPTGSSR